MLKKPILNQRKIKQQLNHIEVGEESQQKIVNEVIML